MKLHVLKTDPNYFEQMWKGLKTSELRLNDRDFKCGDILLLREHSRANNSYTGRSIQASIIYITTYPNALKSGHVMLCLTIPKWWIFKMNGTNRMLN